MDSTTWPAAEGERLAWTQVPPGVREAVAAGLGSPVVEAESQRGGFSPGAAVRVRLADGRRAFVKAVGSSPNPHASGMHRAEAAIAAALPTSAPAPRLLFTHDDGDWVALAFDDVDGRQPALPWRPDELERVLAAMADMTSALTPSPIDAPPVHAKLGPVFRGFRSFAAQPSAAAKLDPWAARHLEALATLEAESNGASAGDTLLHADLRADNLLLTASRVFVVDWPHACVGAPWIDLMSLLPSVAMQGGPDPWRVFDVHPLGRVAPKRAVDAVLTALTGFFLWHGHHPAPPGLSTLRPFQLAQGARALAWLRERTGWA
jgi:aminoglycoside phosphotransferase (APT) family kinase protein